MGKKYKISVLPGDGIGREVVPEAVRTMKAAEEAVSGFNLDFSEFECGGKYFLKHGREWSVEAEEFTKEDADAILLGAVGASTADGKPVLRSDGHLAGYSVVIGLRLELDLYANVRPVRLYEGVPTPLADKDHNDINMVMVRENTEGLYAPQANPSRATNADRVVDNRVITRKGSLRVSRHAFEIAKLRGGCPEDATKRVTCVDKSNLLAGCQLFRSAFDQVGEEYPSIQRDYAYVDAFTQWVIRKPEYYDVVVAPNEFGDIITDLGAAIQGGLGMAPAGSIGNTKAVFEPVHGSAPKYAGKGISNPIASILSGAMLLQWIGDKHNDNRCRTASTAIEGAVMEVLRKGEVRTYDICSGAWNAVSPAGTEDVTDEIIKNIRVEGGD